MTRAGWRARCVFCSSPGFSPIVGLLAPQGAVSTFSENHCGLSATLNAVRAWVAAETKLSFLFLALHRNLHCACWRGSQGHTPRRSPKTNTHRSWDPAWPSIPFSPCSHLAHRLGFMQLLSSQSSQSILPFCRVQTGSWVVDGIDSDVHPTPSLMPQSKKQPAEVGELSS